METHREPDAREQPAGILPALIFGVVGLYLAGLASIVLDEIVFRTFVLHNNLPDWAGDLLGFAYGPLIELLWMF